MSQYRRHPWRLWDVQTLRLPIDHNECFSETIANLCQKTTTVLGGFLTQRVSGTVYLKERFSLETASKKDGGPTVRRLFLYKFFKT